MIILTCLRKYFFIVAYYSVYMRSENFNTLRIGKILTVEINLSILKVMNLGQFVSDLSKLSLKIKLDN